MTARLRSLWEQIRTHLTAIILIALLALVIILIVLSVLGYTFNWSWTGLVDYTSPSHLNGTDFQRGKTLWDWLQLLGVLAIPVVVGLGAAWYTAQQGKVSAMENTDNQREAALQGYIDKMSELLLDKDNPLRESKPEDEVRKIARVRTLTLLPRLDGRRKGSVLQFLYESGLIRHRDKRIIDLERADFSEAYLDGANLSGATLYGVDLHAASLVGASLVGTLLIGTNLRGANVSHGYLTEVNLVQADLHGANLVQAYLNGADLGGANLEETDLERAYLGDANLEGAKAHALAVGRSGISNANLSGANLEGAYLRGATVPQEELDKAKSLKGAIMPDGSKHP